VAVVMSLIEETFACVPSVLSGSALLGTVGLGTLVVVGCSIYWVASAVSTATGVSQGDLAVLCARGHKVDGIIAVRTHSWVDEASPISLWRGSSNWSDTVGTIPWSFVLGTSNNNTIFDSESASSSSTGMIDTNAAWSEQAVLSALLHRDHTTTTPASSDSIRFEVVILSAF
jgi:hypothetical protein